MTTLADKVFAISDSVITESLESGLALTRSGSNKILELNTTGAAIWQLFDGDTPCCQIASEVASQFSMPMEQVMPEV